MSSYLARLRSMQLRQASEAERGPSSTLPTSIREAARLVKIKYEALAQPADYFAALAQKLGEDFWEKLRLELHQQLNRESEYDVREQIHEQIRESTHRSYLKTVRLMNMRATTIADCAALWLYAKYARADSSWTEPDERSYAKLQGKAAGAADSVIPSDGCELDDQRAHIASLVLQVAGRPLAGSQRRIVELLFEELGSAHGGANPIVESIERLAMSDASRGDERHLPDADAIRPFVEALTEAPAEESAEGPTEASTTYLPRWVAFHAVSTKADSSFPILDALIQLRSLLLEGASGRVFDNSSALYGTQIAERSREIIRQSAAQWLLEREPQTALLSSKQRAAAYDAVIVEIRKHSLETGCSFSFDLERDQLRELLDPVLDRAASNIASDVASKRTSKRASGTTASAPSGSASVKAKAHRMGAFEEGGWEGGWEEIEFLGAISAIVTAPVAPSDAHAEAQRDAVPAIRQALAAFAPKSLPSSGGGAAAQVTAEQRRQISLLRVVGSIGAALKCRSLCNPTETQDFIAVQAILNPGAFELLAWLAPGSTSSDPNAAIGPKIIQVPTSGQLIPSAKRSVARGLRAVTGGSATAIDAAIDLVLLGHDGALPTIRSLDQTQFDRLTHQIPLSAQTIARVKYAMLAKHGGAALLRMPEFGVEGDPASSWQGLWNALWSRDARGGLTLDARTAVEFGSVELQQLPENAARSYLSAYFRQFWREIRSLEPVESEPIGSASASPAPNNATVGSVRSRHRAAADDGLTPDVSLRTGALLATLGFAGEVFSAQELGRMLPLTALALVLPQSKFNEVPAEEGALQRLFHYSGPKARVVWTHAWRRLEAGVPIDAVRHPAREGVVAAIEAKEFELAVLKKRSPEAKEYCETDGAPIEGSEDIARILANDPVVGPLLIKQAVSVGDFAFLARVGDASLIAHVSDQMIDRLVSKASDQLDELIANAGSTQRRPPQSVLRANLSFNEKTIALLAGKAALLAVHRQAGALLKRLCDGPEAHAMLAQLPKALAIDARSETATSVAEGGVAPTEQSLASTELTPRMATALRIVRIIGQSKGRCEVPFEWVHLLSRLFPSRQIAISSACAALAHRPLSRRNRQLHRAMGPALELARSGLADEFPQILEICLTPTLDHRYTTHLIPKRRGGTREICEPDPDLKRLQRKILARFLSRVRIAPQAQGFVRGRGTRSNAEAHVRKDIVLNVDIRNFFGSLPPERIRDAISQCRIGLLSDAAIDVLVKIVTRSNALPQGAPTSPAITNIALRHIDEILAKCCRRRGITYTRYADDLTFSGDDPERLISSARPASHSMPSAPKPVPSVIPLVEELLARVGLELHPDKTRIYRRGRRQIVTGLVVNECPNLPRRERRNLRAAAHRCATGQAMHWCGRPMSRSSFEGRLAYLHSVNEAAASNLLARIEKGTES